MKWCVYKHIKEEIEQRMKMKQDDMGLDKHTNSYEKSFYMQIMHKHTEQPCLVEI